MVGGSLSFVNYWNLNTNISSLQLKAESDNVEIFHSGSVSIGSATESFNRNATMHGIGRSERGNGDGTALDNFNLVLI